MLFTPSEFPREPEPSAVWKSAAAGPEELGDRHVDELLIETTNRGASDLHLTEGLPPMIRLDGKLQSLPFLPLISRDIQRLVYDVMTRPQIQAFENVRELDFSYGIAGVGRFRFNVYRQRGAVGAAMRAIPHRIPALEELKLPSNLRDLVRKRSGLVLVTGATGSGKSTTIAALIDVINTERECHVMTIEDPIEYLHTHKRAMVNQREVGQDTNTFANALRAVLREDPDVILIGEMRDLETIGAAITMAETGHLVLATLHTRSAALTLDRIVDVFPAYQQDQIKVQLSNALEGVVSQQLLPRLGGGRVPAVEVMLATSAVRNLVRTGKTDQLYSVIETGLALGMQTMDRSLANLVRSGAVSLDVARGSSIDPDNFFRTLRGMGYAGGLV